MDVPCQPCKRQFLAFHRGFIPHGVSHHSPTPSARRPPLDGGVETEEPPHDPGVVSWNPSPLQGNTRSKASHVNIVARCLAVCQGSGFFARFDSKTISSSAGVLPTPPNLCVVLEFFSKTRLSTFGNQTSAKRTMFRSKTFFTERYLLKICENVKGSLPSLRNLFCEFYLPRKLI